MMYILRFFNNVIPHNVILLHVDLPPSGLSDESIFRKTEQYDISFYMGGTFLLNETPLLSQNQSDYLPVHRQHHVLVLLKHTHPHTLYIRMRIFPYNVHGNFSQIHSLVEMGYGQVSQKGDRLM